MRIVNQQTTRLPADAAQGAVARADPGAAGAGAARAGRRSRRALRGGAGARDAAPAEPTRARLRQEERRRGAPARARRSTWSWPPRRARSSTGASPASVEDVRALAHADAAAPRAPNFHAEAEGDRAPLVSHRSKRLLEAVRPARARADVSQCSTRGARLAALWRACRSCVRARVIVEGALVGHAPHAARTARRSSSPSTRSTRPATRSATSTGRRRARRQATTSSASRKRPSCAPILLLDASASMGYRRRGVSKLEYATKLAAALGYLLAQQGDPGGAGAVRREDAPVSAAAHARRAHPRSAARAGGRLRRRPHRSRGARSATSASWPTGAAW